MLISGWVSVFHWVNSLEKTATRYPFVNFKITQHLKENPCKQLGVQNMFFMSFP